MPHSHITEKCEVHIIRRYSYMLMLCLTGGKPILQRYMMVQPPPLPVRDYQGYIHQKCLIRISRRCARSTWCAKGPIWLCFAWWTESAKTTKSRAAPIIDFCFLRLLLVWRHLYHWIALLESWPDHPLKRASPHSVFSYVGPKITFKEKWFALFARDFSSWRAYRSLQLYVGEVVATPSFR